MHNTDPITAFIQTALAAADPRQRLSAHLQAIAGQVESARQVWLVGAGKASLEMALEALDQLDKRITGGAVACVPERLQAIPADEISRLPFRLYAVGHPLPDERNLQASAAIRDVVQKAGKQDLVLALISGGGSAHLTLPVEDLTLLDLQRITQGLMKAGARIEELNAVRKHLEQLKGGRLLRLADPATVRVFVLSDVMGDPLDVIASGPFAPDEASYAQALQVLDRYGLEPAGRVREYLQAGARGEKSETLKPGDPILDKVEHTLIGSNRLAMEAVEKAARSQGIRVEHTEGEVQGEAREVGEGLGRLARKLLAEGEPGMRLAILGGETTVTVRGQGRGGRNQEMALAAAIAIEGLAGVQIACFSTDGIDGPTDAAGARVDGETCTRAKARGLDPKEFLDRNDSYSFFSQVGGLILTGPTGTNVNDLALVLVET